MTAIRIATVGCCLAVGACAARGVTAQESRNSKTDQERRTSAKFRPPPVQKVLGSSPKRVQPAPNNTRIQEASRQEATPLAHSTAPILNGRQVAFGSLAHSSSNRSGAAAAPNAPINPEPPSYVGSLFFGGPRQSMREAEGHARSYNLSNELKANDFVTNTKLRVFPTVARKELPGNESNVSMSGSEFSTGGVQRLGTGLILAPSSRVAANSMQGEILAEPIGDGIGSLPRPSSDDPQKYANPFSNESVPPTIPLESVPAPLPSAAEQETIQDITGRIARGRVLPERTAVAIGLQEVVSLALYHAKALKVVRIQPAEAKQVVNQEFGQFDWNTFVETLFSSNANPVGNLSQTNLNLNQVRNDENRVDVGVRKQTLTGGQLELRQSLGTADSNSGLLNPEEPGNARISITYSQEFLRDGGQDVVLGQALIASLNADVAHADAFAQMSDVLRDVLAQYWNLYQARGDYFVQLSLVEWARETLEILEARRKIDAERNSIEQARALWLEARANLETARANVLTAQDQLYRLVNAPEIDSNAFELVLTAEPQSTSRPLDVLVELQEAIRFRAEVAQKLIEIRAAAVTHHISLNQLLPRLTFSIESSLNGIDENRDFWGALRNTSDVDPSYAANVAFEFPIGNHTAKAQNKQARLTLQRLQFEYEDEIEQVRLDVAAAIRTLNASNTILEQRRRTLAAREEEIEYLRIRRDVIPQDGASPSLLLEQLFQAINRQVVSQQAYIAAISDQQDAFAELLRAKGLLVNLSEVPRDILMAVPVPSRAFREQRSNRRGFKSEAYDRAVLPGLADPIPNYR